MRAGLFGFGAACLVGGLAYHIWAQVALGSVVLAGLVWEAVFR